MSSKTFANLDWLPKPADDFSARCKAALDVGDGVGRELQFLATSALDQNQLARLANVVEKLRAKQADLKPLVPFRLGILSNSTTDFIVPALIATGARHGIALEVIKGGYDQVLQDALTPDSRVNAAKPDAVLLAIDYRGLPIQGAGGSAEKGREAVNASLGFLQAAREGIQRNSGAMCIFQTISPPPETLFGNMDGVHPGAVRRIVDSINAGIGESVSGSTDVVVDIAHLASTVGLADWHSPSEWNMAKIPFSSALLPFYADHVCRTIAARRGKSRRGLILDLDNTLWGGVIGDDGLEHIKIGQGDPTGEAYLSVQQLVLELRARGVVLAVCSKNEDEIARAAFQKHPEMLLKENHIAVFQANWKDKATNIKAIAEELSLGLDAFVFLDDNPVERLLIRQMLPQVAVPELPDDPALYARTLAAAGYFEAVAFSEDDLRRADFYQDNARRVSLKKQAGDLESYLASLQMEITFQPFDETGRARIAQLINKSNQFNLTTKRYTEAQVAAMQHDPAYFTLQVRLSDTFGDNGMISVVICRRVSKEEWEIDTWLMSCRVLGRRAENMVLRELLEQAKKEGVHKLVGTYIPTDRNKLVQEHYPKLGFRLVKTEDQVSTYELDVDSALVEGAPMKIKRIDAEPVAASEKSFQPVAAPANEVRQKAPPVPLETKVQPERTPRVAPGDPIESQLVRIWEEVLDRENISTRDDFFALGGDSLLGIRLMIEIEKKFNKRFEISILATHPTIESLARELRGTKDSGHAPASNQVESELVTIWEELLNREKIGTRDDFFALGGDSLLGIRLVIEIEKKFNKRFEVSKLATHPTIEAQARELGGTPERIQPYHIVPMRPQGDNTTLFCIHCGTGHVLRYRALVSMLDSDIPVYGVRAPELRAMTNVPTVEDLAALYLADIQRIRPHGPYQLLGFCVGGTLALEVARRFKEMGETVSSLVLVETLNAAHYRKLSLAESLQYRSSYLFGRLSKYGSRLFRGEWKEIYAGVRNTISWYKKKWRSGASSSEPFAEKPWTPPDIYDNIALLAAIGEAYEPKLYPGKIHLIRAEEQVAEREKDMTFGWQDVAQEGLDVCTLPGDHYTLLEKPFVSKVADKVEGWLDKKEVRV
jgi:FkbH-like protein